MVGAAVNVALLPEQIDNEPVVILTVGTIEEVIFIFSELLIAIIEAAQDALLVITTVTTSLSAIADVANVALLLPVFTPFIFH